ncbi:MAG: hypothetical protein COA69_01205 [Robiginitomaculum sp.]|nr:MAG: hypothetical protein COA69_01205 [Robiginitomaculum sp.]
MPDAFESANILRRFMGGLIVVLGIVLSACQLTQAATPGTAPDWRARKTAILEYLTSVSEGGQTLSGTQVNEYEVFIKCTSYDRLHAMTGKKAAVLGLELMFAIEYEGYADHLVRLAREHAQAGGLVTLAWHARNPLKTCPRGEFYECSKMMMSDDMMALMLTDGTHENVLFKKDIAAVAPVFKRMQDAGIPVLFRPFHEMNGNWFWWGATDRFADLWSILHHEMETVHGLKNIIWVWGSADRPNSPHYAPPNGTFDIVGADIYETDNDSELFIDRWKDARKVSSSAPFAFTEIGRVPSDRVLAETKPAFVFLWGGEFLKASWAMTGKCDKCNTEAETIAFMHKKTVLSLEGIPADTRLTWTQAPLSKREINACPVPN